MTKKCSLCGHDAICWLTNRDCTIYDCPRCGNFEISREAEFFIKSPENEKNNYLISGLTRYRKEYNLDMITILTNNLSQLKEDYYVPRNLSQKLNLILKYISNISNYAGEVIEFNVILDYPIAFSKNVKEFSFFLAQLENNRYLEKVDIGHKYRLSIEGWNKIEELNTQVIEKKQGFIAMWFNEDLNEVYINGLSKAIKDCGYEPMRIDLKQHNNKIDDEIIAEIRNSKFLIADFTGNRGGVYYEAGFAYGLGIPVIWTCKKEDVSELHFDTRQYNHITWTNSEDLYIQLVNRIKATIK